MINSSNWSERNHFNFNETFIALVTGFYFECAKCSEFPFRNLFGSIRIVWLTSQALWNLMWILACYQPIELLFYDYSHMLVYFFFSYESLLSSHSAWPHSIVNVFCILFGMVLSMKMVRSQSTFSIKSHPFNAIRHSWVVYGSVDLCLKFEKINIFHQIAPLN